MEKVDLSPYHYDFGSTGLRISPMSFGTVKIGRNQGVKNKCSDGFSLPSMRDIVGLLELCRDRGVNAIDTSPAYGLSEQNLGEAIQNSSVNRDYFVISTKVGEEFQNGSSEYDFSVKHTRKSVERSLKLFKTDYIDSVLVHCSRDDFAELSESEVLSELEKMKSEGLIRSYGASTNSVEGGMFAAEHCDSVMVSFNSLYQKELCVIERALELKKGVFVKKALMQGYFNTGKYGNPMVAKDCLADIYKISNQVSIVLGTLSLSHFESNVRDIDSILKK
jgi:aryl-alcohol dehydrogenase-like predicted oxidoreductase